MPSHDSGAPGPVEIPVDKATLAEVPSWAKEAARQEESRWDHLEDTRRQNDKRWLAVYGWILVIITVMFTAIFCAAVIVWATHQLAPDSWTWLSKERLSEIKSTLLSGGVGAIIISVVRTQISKAR